MKTFFGVLFTLAGFVPLANTQVYVSPWESGQAQYRAYRIQQDIATCGGVCSPGPAGYGAGRGALIGAIAVGAMSGASVGYMTGGGRGAAIDAGVGGGVSGLAAYAMNRAARGPQPRDCSKKKPGDKKCEAALAEAQAQAELAERQLRGGRITNKTPFTLEVFDGRERIAILRPGQSVQALEALEAYEGVMLVPSQTPGRREDRVAASHVSDDMGGWVFHAPRLPRQGGAR